MSNTTITALLGIAALTLYAMNTQAAYVSGDAPPLLPPPDPITLDTAIQDIAMQPDPQSAINAFLAMIRQFESGNDYYILYGGGHFYDDSVFPDVHVPFYNPRRPGPSGTPNDYSTAAGAYQINKPTYDTFAPQQGITSFTPADQDTLAYAILTSVGADTAIASGDITGALQLASRKWASLPGSNAMQNPQSLQTALDTYNSYLSTG